MRRSDIELPDDAARFVERHPELIARLAGQTHDAGTVDLQSRDAQQARFGGYVRERRAFAGTAEARSAGEQFLARFAPQ